jgi:hypothetical protein
VTISDNRLLQTKSGSFSTLFSSSRIIDEGRNPDIVDPMIKLGRRMLAKFSGPSGPGTIEELRAARRKLYKHYGFPEPAPEFTMQQLKVDAPRYFAFARVAQIILLLLASAKGDDLGAPNPKRKKRRKK